MEYIMPMKDRKFVGFGTIQYSKETPFLLHFLVEEKEGDEGHFFSAINLEFALFSTFSTEQEVIKQLEVHIVDYINAVMSKGRGVEELKECSSLPTMDEAWAIYRKLEFAFAENAFSENRSLASPSCCVDVYRKCI